MKNDMSLYSILKSSLRRLLSLGLVMAMMMGFVPGLRIEVNDEGEISVKREESPFVAVAKAAEGDPLQSVATVTTGGIVSSYVNIDSTYVPSGYTEVVTGDSAYKTSPGTLFSYHTSRNGDKENSYVVTRTEDLSWAKNSDSTGVTGSLKANAVSDYKGCGNIKNGALCAKVNSKVIRIQALADVSITFSYSSKMTVVSRNGKHGSVQEGVYTLKTTSDSPPTISEIMNGTKRSQTNLTDTSAKVASATGTVTEALAGGEYLYLYFYGFMNDQDSNSVDTTDYTYTASVTGFQITPVTQNYTLTVGNSDCANNLVGGGKVAVNGTSITIPSAGTATGLADALSGTSVSLSVSSVPQGYLHIGWRKNDEIIFKKTIDFALESDTTVYALLIPEVTVTMGSNGYSDATYAYKKPSGATVGGADQYIARNSAATFYYKTLAEAFSATDVVVLLGNIILNGDFTIPRGKTLSLQRDWGDPATLTLQKAAGTAGVSVFAKATINGTVTLQGNLVASALQSNSNDMNGRAVGGIGQFIVNGTVDVLSGGKLCAYGMITGPGKINVASGGIVYELMEIRDMRSIYVMPTVVSGGAFPLNHYFVKTNEVTTTYSAGSNLIGCYYIAISGVTSDGNVAIIGSYGASSESLFMIKSGTLTKSFSSSSPYNNKTIFRAENGSDIQTGKFTIKIATQMATYTIDTSKFYLPLSYCYAIEIVNGGSMTLNYDYKLLPGALIDVQEGGTLTIPSGKNLVLYRANDYDFTRLTGFSAIAYPGAFTKPSGLSYATNTAANVGSAKLIVNGTVNVNGGLYVTNQPTKQTKYDGGYNYLTGTGRINVNGSLKAGSIDEWTQSDNSTASKATVAYVPIMGLTDYDADTDDGQTGYESFTQPTWYGYINGSGINVWSTSKPVTLSYDANGGSGEAPASVRIPAGTELTVAKNHPFTHSGGKEFGGWNTVSDGSGTAHASGGTITVNGDTTLYAQWNAVSIVIGENVTKYTTLAKAAADYKGKGYIQMIASTTEPGFTIGKNVYLDLNGKTVTLKDGTGATGTLTINKDCTLYGLDHTTDEYTDTTYGKIIGTVGGEGTVALTYQAPTAADGTFQRYVKFEDTANNALSFHRYNISVSGYHFDFNANDKSALYFQGTFSGSDTVKNLLKDVGFQVNGTRVWFTEQGKTLTDVTAPKYEMQAAIVGKFTTEELQKVYEVYALLDFTGDKNNPTMSNPKSLSFWAALQQRYKELTAKDEASITDKEKAELAVLEQLFNGTSDAKQNTVT